MGCAVRAQIRTHNGSVSNMDTLTTGAVHSNIQWTAGLS